MTTLNTAIASAKEAIEKKVCTTAMIPAEDLQALIDAVEAAKQSQKIADFQIEVFNQRNQRLDVWEERYEKAMLKKGFSLMFNLGRLWADRPWRKRK